MCFLVVMVAVLLFLTLALVAVVSRPCRSPLIIYKERMISTLSFLSSRILMMRLHRLFRELS